MNVYCLIWIWQVETEGLIQFNCLDLSLMRVTSAAEFMTHTGAMGVSQSTRLGVADPTYVAANSLLKEYGSGRGPDIFFGGGLNSLLTLYLPKSIDLVFWAPWFLLLIWYMTSQTWKLRYAEAKSHVYVCKPSKLTNSYSVRYVVKGIGFQVPTTFMRVKRDIPLGGYGFRQKQVHTCAKPTRGTTGGCTQTTYANTLYNYPTNIQRILHAVTWMCSQLGVCSSAQNQAYSADERLANEPLFLWGQLCWQRSVSLQGGSAQSVNNYHLGGALTTGGWRAVWSAFQSTKAAPPPRGCTTTQALRGRGGVMCQCLEHRCVRPQVVERYRSKEEHTLYKTVYVTEKSVFRGPVDLLDPKEGYGKRRADESRSINGKIDVRLRSSATVSHMQEQISNNRKAAHDLSDLSEPEEWVRFRNGNVSAEYPSPCARLQFFSRRRASMHLLISRGRGEPEALWTVRSWRFFYQPSSTQTTLWGFQAVRMNHGCVTIHLLINWVDANLRLCHQLTLVCVACRSSIYWDLPSLHILRRRSRNGKKQLRCISKRAIFVIRPYVTVIHRAYQSTRGLQRQPSRAYGRGTSGDVVDGTLQEYDTRLSKWGVWQRRGCHTTNRRVAEGGQETRLWEGRTCDKERVFRGTDVCEQGRCKRDPVIKIKVACVRGVGPKEPAQQKVQIRSCDLWGCVLVMDSSIHYDRSPKSVVIDTTLWLRLDVHVLLSENVIELELPRYCLTTQRTGLPGVVHVCASAVEAINGQARPSIGQVEGRIPPSSERKDGCRCINCGFFFFSANCTPRCWFQDLTSTFEAGTLQRICFFQVRLRRRSLWSGIGFLLSWFPDADTTHTTYANTLYNVPSGCQVRVTLLYPAAKTHAQPATLSLENAHVQLGDRADTSFWDVLVPVGRRPVVSVYACTSDCWVLLHKGTYTSADGLPETRGDSTQGYTSYSNLRDAWGVLGIPRILYPVNWMWTPKAGLNLVEVHQIKWIEFIWEFYSIHNTDWSLTQVSNGRAFYPAGAWSVLGQERLRQNQRSELRALRTACVTDRRVTKEVHSRVNGAIRNSSRFVKGSTQCFGVGSSSLTFHNVNGNGERTSLLQVSRLPSIVVNLLSGSNRAPIHSRPHREYRGFARLTVLHKPRLFQSAGLVKRSGVGAMCKQTYIGWRDGSTYSNRDTIVQGSVRGYDYTAYLTSSKLDVYLGSVARLDLMLSFSLGQYLRDLYAQKHQWFLRRDVILLTRCPVPKYQPDHKVYSDTRFSVLSVAARTPFPQFAGRTRWGGRLSHPCKIIQRICFFQVRLRQRSMCTGLRTYLVKLVRCPPRQSTQVKGLINIRSEMQKWPTYLQTVGGRLRPHQVKGCFGVHSRAAYVNVNLYPVDYKLKPRTTSARLTYLPKLPSFFPGSRASPFLWLLACMVGLVLWVILISGIGFFGVGLYSKVQANLHINSGASHSLSLGAFAGETPQGASGVYGLLRGPNTDAGCVLQSPRSVIGSGSMSPYAGLASKLWWPSLSLLGEVIDPILQLIWCPIAELNTRVSQTLWVGGLYYYLVIWVPFLFIQSGLHILVSVFNVLSWVCVIPLYVLLGYSVEFTSWTATFNLAQLIGFYQEASSWCLLYLIWLRWLVLIYVFRVFSTSLHLPSFHLYQRYRCRHGSYGSCGPTVLRKSWIVVLRESMITQTTFTPMLYKDASVLASCKRFVGVAPTLVLSRLHILRRRSRNGKKQIRCIIIPRSLHPVNGWCSHRFPQYDNPSLCTAYVLHVRPHQCGQLNYTKFKYGGCGSSCRDKWVHKLRRRSRNGKKQLRCIIMQSKCLGHKQTLDYVGDLRTVGQRLVRLPNDARYSEFTYFGQPSSMSSYTFAGLSVRASLGNLWLFGCTDPIHLCNRREVFRFDYYSSYPRKGRDPVVASELELGVWRCIPASHRTIGVWTLQSSKSVISIHAACAQQRWSGCNTYTPIHPSCQRLPSMRMQVGGWVYGWGYLRMRLYLGVISVGLIIVLFLRHVRLVVSNTGLFYLGSGHEGFHSTQVGLGASSALHPVPSTDDHISIIGANYTPRAALVSRPYASISSGWHPTGKRTRLSLVISPGDTWPPTRLFPRYVRTYGISGDNLPTPWGVHVKERSKVHVKIHTRPHFLGWVRVHTPPIEDGCVAAKTARLLRMYYPGVGVLDAASSVLGLVPSPLGQVRSSNTTHSSIASTQWWPGPVLREPLAADLIKDSHSIRRPRIVRLRTIGGCVHPRRVQRRVAAVVRTKARLRSTLSPNHVCTQSSLASTLWMPGYVLRKTLPAAHTTYGHTLHNPHLVRQAGYNRTLAYLSLLSINIEKTPTSRYAHPNPPGVRSSCRFVRFLRNIQSNTQMPTTVHGMNKRSTFTELYVSLLFIMLLCVWWVDWSGSFPGNWGMPLSPGPGSIFDWRSSSFFDVTPVHTVESAVRGLSGQSTVPTSWANMSSSFYDSCLFGTTGRGVEWYPQTPNTLHRTVPSSYITGNLHDLSLHGTDSQVNMSFDVRRLLYTYWQSNRFGQGFGWFSQTYGLFDVIFHSIICLLCVNCFWVLAIFRYLRVKLRDRFI